MKALFVIALFLASCTGNNAPAEGPIPLPVPEPRVEPIRVVVILDISGSAPLHGVEHVGIDDFLPLIARISASGGEIGYGIVAEDSNRPLLRFFVPPPIRPPDPPPERGNAFELARQHAEHAQKVQVYEAAVATRSARISRERVEFLEALKVELNRPPTARRSDVAGAVLRAEAFLNEPAAFEARQFAVLLTDGLDNVSRTIPEIRSGAEYIVANAVKEIGMLDEINPVFFESGRAAMRYVLTEE